MQISTADDTFTEDNASQIAGHICACRMGIRTQLRHMSLAHPHSIVLEILMRRTRKSEPECESERDH